MTKSVSETIAGIDAPSGGQSLLRSLIALFPAPMCGKPTIAAVGGGGKTGTLFALASSLADSGVDVALTTTTHIRDPRAESGRRFDAVVVDPSLADPDGTPVGSPRKETIVVRSSGTTEAVTMAPLLSTSRHGAITVFASAIEGAGEHRLAGIHRSRARGLLTVNGAVLVEADGSRMLPVKAPADHEPAMPYGADLVLGLVGLDCLGRPMDGRAVHRPELFGPIASCEPGETIRASHLAALASSPAGLFKDSPAGAMRVLVLNKADALAEQELRDMLLLFGGEPPDGVDAVILYSAINDTARMLSRAGEPAKEG